MDGYGTICTLKRPETLKSQFGENNQFSVPANDVNVTLYKGTT